MKVRWSDHAVQELDAILSYIAAHQPSASAGVARRIQDRVRLLEQFPLAGHKTDVENVRALSVVRYPFVIFHVVDDVADEVVIVSIRHTARREITSAD
ncbi:type II toxin-antitoxin system RelE/ParE family toxin [Rhodopseudomonas palustris]|uniref:Type II toxin-antitoxin system RelE/ParE family toxin n=1 Tax=Rhodopseudomonas palustris TaxID=1076 RepID=A0A418VI90_RHOPL|nr:type II toxin-antitoxin system RelE/ParE family toxin [Rhodopseudomonas palustris]RJF75771.1 type II toxin-antitoxin system RelE/ParE family toxin [Rhodopseudomonas palustris]